MPNKLPITTSSRIRSTLRRLWMSSRERSAALKRTGYKCAVCSIKQSSAQGREVRLEVHHIGGVTNWTAIIEAIREHLLCDPAKLQPLCKDCHAKAHEQD